jgi:hypothetical protein
VQNSRITRMARDVAQLSPVLATVLAVLCMILGILVIIYPVLLAWLIGITLILAGVAILATLFTPQP